MRLAMLGSPGVGRGGYLPNVRVLGTPASIVGAGATYAPVVAGHKLLLQVNGIPGTVTITFTGLENNQATFLVTLEAQRKGFRALPAGAQIELDTFAVGSYAGAEILPASDADVLASLGLAAGVFAAGAGAGLINANYMAQAVRYFGGPTSNQHAIMGIHASGRAVIFMVDRQVASGPSTGIASDLMQVTPSPA
jgi:hypothetical protein